MRIVDNDFAIYRQGYELARICKLDSGHTIRARVRRDTYREQSHAVAEVLTPAMTWTPLVTKSADAWQPDSPYLTSTTPPNPAKRQQAEALLDQVAAALLERAATVLEA